MYNFAIFQRFCRSCSTSPDFPVLDPVPWQSIVVFGNCIYNYSLLNCCFRDKPLALFVSLVEVAVFIPLELFFPLLILVLVSPFANSSVRHKKIELKVVL